MFLYIIKGIIYDTCNSYATQAQNLRLGKYTSLYCIQSDGVTGFIVFYFECMADWYFYV